MVNPVMDSRSKLKWAIFQSLIRIMNFALLIHIASANIIDRHSSIFHSDQYPTMTYKYDDSNLLNSASNQLPNDTIQLPIQNTLNTVDQYAVDLQPNVHSHPYKRSITPSSTPTFESSHLHAIENQVNNLQIEFTDFTDSAELKNDNDYDKLNTLRTTIDEFSELLQNLRNEYAGNEQRMRNITQKLETTTILAIVQSINASQFSFADEQLQEFADDSIYTRIVQQVYLQHADTFDLLLSFGGSIIDLERKFKVYQALYHVVRTNSPKNIQKLFQLSQSIRKGVYEVSTGTTLEDNSRSLIRTLWEENEKPILALISATFLKNESRNWSTIKQLNDEICKSRGFKYFGDVYKEVIENIWNTTSIGQILFVAHRITAIAEERIIIHENIFRKLDGDGKLYTDDVLPLVRYMKANWEDPEFNSVDWRSRYKFIINKLPNSLKNIVYQSIVCIKYSHFDEYLYAEESNKEYNFAGAYRSAFTWIPKGKHESLEFKWKFSFTDENKCKILNVKYNESLVLGSYVAEKSIYTYYLVLQSEANYWNFHVDGESVRLNIDGDNFYIYAGGKRDDYRRNVFAHNHATEQTYPLKWDITDCSDNL